MTSTLLLLSSSNFDVHSKFRSFTDAKQSGRLTKERYKTKENNIPQSRKKAISKYFTH
jgi:hypothetical protein